MDHQLAVTTGAAERYVLGQMPEDEQAAYELHFFDCPACTADVENATLFVENGREVARDQARDVAPAPALTPSSPRLTWGQRLAGLWSEPLFGAAVAASALLAIVTVYQTGFRIPSLERQLAESEKPRAFLSFAIKSASRGEDNTITVPPGAGAFAIHMDLPEVAFSRYRCEIEGAGATFAVESEAPLPGAPLNILVPSATLSPGAYTIHVTGHERGAASTPVGVFRFVLKKGSSAP